MKINNVRDILFCIVTICAAICFFAAYFIREHDAMDFILGCAWICISAIKIESITKRAKQKE